MTDDITSSELSNKPTHDAAASHFKSADSSASSTSRARSVVLVGLCVAITAVCAWITIPLGPVPFTLQMFALTFVICASRPAQAVATIYIYELLGAVGVPVFSGMRGGLGVLAGPTGGFLLGYLVGVPLAALFLWGVKRLVSKFGKASNQPAARNANPSAWATLPRRTRIARTLASCGLGIMAGIIFTVVSYLFGCAWYTAITGVPVAVAFATCVLPFIIPDIAKIVLAAICANSVQAAITPQSR